MATTTHTAPIGIDQLNTNFYVYGNGFGFSSIQAAVDYVRIHNGAVGRVVVCHGYPYTESIWTLTGGAQGIVICDERSGSHQNYGWDGAKFAALDELQYSGFIAQGLTGSFPASTALNFDPAGNGGIGRGNLIVSADAGKGMPTFSLVLSPQDGTTPIRTFLSAGMDTAGLPRIEVPACMQLLSGTLYHYNQLWAGQNPDVTPAKGMSIATDANANTIDFQGQTIGAAYDQEIRINPLGGNVQIGESVAITQAGNVTVGGTMTLSQDPAQPLEAATRHYVDQAIIDAGGFVFPPAGVAISTGEAWGASIDPATLATFPNAGIPVSTGTAWGTSVNPGMIAYVNAHNTFTQVQTIAVNIGGVGTNCFSILDDYAANGVNLLMMGQSSNVANPLQMLFQIDPAKGTNGAAIIHALKQGIAFTDLWLLPNGGKVFIGPDGLDWFNPGAPTDNKAWDAVVDGNGDMHYRTLNDGLTTAHDWLTVFRGGSRFGTDPATAFQIYVGTLLKVGSGAQIQGGYDVTKASGLMGFAQGADVGYIDSIGAGGNRGTFAFRVASTAGANMQNALLINNAGVATFPVMASSYIMEAVSGGPAGPPYNAGAVRLMDDGTRAYLDCTGPDTTTRGEFKVRLMTSSTAQLVDGLWLDAGANLHIPGTVYGGGFVANSTSFLNWGGGASILTYFGNGAGGTVGTLDTAGNLHVNGAITAGSKSFLITHPLDATKNLEHGSLEGPEYGVYYRGEGVTVDGKAIITLPEYFEALTLPDQRTVQLTAIVETEPPVFAQLAAGRVAGGQFAVYSSNASQKFFWEVKAVRGDIPALVVVQDKPVEPIPAAPPIPPEPPTV